MTTSKSVVATKPRQTVEDMFDGIEPLTAFEVKKDAVATQLTGLMLHCRKTRSDMAAELGWQKSRVTKVLSGNNNLTIKTICEFTGLLGYDFDVVFHGRDEPRPKQPWQIHRKEETNLLVENLRTLNLPIVMQSPGEVAIDLITGNAKDNYFSFDTSVFKHVKHHVATTHLLAAATSGNLIQNVLHVSDKLHVQVVKNEEAQWDNSQKIRQ